MPGVAGVRNRGARVTVWGSPGEPRPEPRPGLESEGRDLRSANERRSFFCETVVTLTKWLNVNEKAPKTKGEGENPPFGPYGTNSFPNGLSLVSIPASAAGVRGAGSGGLKDEK